MYSTYSKWSHLYSSTSGLAMTELGCLAGSPLTDGAAFTDWMGSQMTDAAVDQAASDLNTIAAFLALRTVRSLTASSLNGSIGSDRADLPGSSRQQRA
jgi:hypothetical protein